ncbi:hypothetical protein cyc_01169 [Cyclospora cayetanensis]|uniref:Transmembrane protein n=1 Tax=Cyclospora cayetanensis TaxID=88456 RepID=A0A1D3D5R9_9EIME|nr:hypothetical protein cyc_01169 [Cyclospora cayetanensis]
MAVNTLDGMHEPVALISSDGPFHGQHTKKALLQVAHPPLPNPSAGPTPNPEEVKRLKYFGSSNRWRRHKTFQVLTIITSVVFFIWTMYLCRLKGRTEYKVAAVDRRLASGEAGGGDEGAGPSSDPKLCEGAEAVLGTEPEAEAAGEPSAVFDPAVATTSGTSTGEQRPRKRKKKLKHLKESEKEADSSAKKAKHGEPSIDPLEDFEALLQAEINLGPGTPSSIELSPFSLGQYLFPDSPVSQEEVPGFLIGHGEQGVEEASGHMTSPYSSPAIPEDEPFPDILGEFLEAEGLQEEKWLQLFDENLLGGSDSAPQVEDQAGAPSTVKQPLTTQIGEGTSSLSQEASSYSSDISPAAGSSLISIFPGSSPDLARHPYYRVPVGDPGATLPPFDPQNIPGKQGVPLSEILGDIRQLLLKSHLSELDMRTLQVDAYRLVQYANWVLSQPVQGKRAAIAVYFLARRFLVADAMWCINQVLGPPMNMHLWWDAFMEPLAEHVSVPPESKSRTGADWTLMAERLMVALYQYKLGQRPAAQEVVELKRQIFRWPCICRDFKSNAWDPWRDDDTGNDGHS